MDPNACLGLILDAVEMDDREEIEEHLENLLNWIRRGGALPTDRYRKVDRDEDLDDVENALRE